MKLYNAAAPNPRRVRIFLAEKGLEIPMTDVDIMAGGSRTPEFLARNSLGECPVLELDNGTCIAESIAICRYLEALHPTPALFGTTPEEIGRIEMWNRRLELKLSDALGTIALHTFDFFADRVKQVPAMAEAGRERSIRLLNWLDGELADGRPWVAGDDFSVADITGMTAMLLSDFTRVAIPDTATHVARWNAALRARPSWNA